MKNLGCALAICVAITAILFGGFWFATAEKRAKDKADIIAAQAFNDAVRADIERIKNKTENLRTDADEIVAVLPNRMLPKSITVFPGKDDPRLHFFGACAVCHGELQDKQWWNGSGLREIPDEGDPFKSDLGDAILTILDAERKTCIVKDSEIFLNVNGRILKAYSNEDKATVVLYAEGITIDLATDSRKHCVSTWISDAFTDTDLMLINSEVKRIIATRKAKLESEQADAHAEELRKLLKLPSKDQRPAELKGKE